MFKKKKKTEQRELTPEEKKAIQEAEKQAERKQLLLAVFSGSLIYTLVGILLYFEWGIFATICGIALIIYSVIQFIWVFAHKNLSSFEKNFFAIVNFVPYCIFCLTTY